MNEQPENLLGEANAFVEVLEQVSQVAKLNKPVLVIGERGTGKELIAHRLHYLSNRWQGPFISLNCAALNENLLDSSCSATRPARLPARKAPSGALRARRRRHAVSR